MTKNTKKQDLLPVLRNLLLKHAAHTQQELCSLLIKHGYAVNQVKISRLLRQLGAVKTKNEHDQIVYWLPKEPPPVNLSQPINTLVIGIEANENMIVIYTTPGAASAISRYIDYLSAEYGVLGTIAGDDTVFIAPKSVKYTQPLCEKIKAQLGFV